MRPFGWLATTAILILLGISLLLVGCDQAATPTDISALPSGEPTAAGGASGLQPTVGPGSATPPAQAATTLVVWTTDAFSPTQAITSGQIVAEQVAAFEAARPDIQIEFVRKKPYHEGGIKEYLLNTGAVIPELLPDLAFIDTDELEEVIGAGLVQPLDDLVTTELLGDLYPFARESCTFDGQLYCLPFRADLDHLVFDQGVLESAPSSVPGVLFLREPYIFPAGGREGLVNDSFLTHYLDIRQLPAVASPKEPFLEANSLVTALRFYEHGGTYGIIPAQVLDYETTLDCWRAYLAQEATLAQVSAHVYLAERGQDASTGVAPIPGQSGPAAAIGRVWALAVIAANPDRQAIALEFVDQLLEPAVYASWSRAAGYLPTRQEALRNWDQTDPYTPFIQERLQGARPRPRFPDYVQVAGELQVAVEAVLSGRLTAEEAATQAIDNSQ